MNTPKFDRLLLIPIGISLVLAFFTISVFNSYAQKVDQRFASQDSRIGELSYLNDTYNTYRQQISDYFSGLSRQVNLTSQDSLRRINNLTESDKNLQNQLGADEKKLDNLTAYIGNLNLSCTNTTTTIYVNQTTPAPVQASCRQALIDRHQLGGYFDVVSCCELRGYGFADECCACYK